MPERFSVNCFQEINRKTSHRKWVNQKASKKKEFAFDRGSERGSNKFVVAIITWTCKCILIHGNCLVVH